MRCLSLLLIGLLAGCILEPAGPGRSAREAEAGAAARGRLLSRPGTPPRSRVPPGLSSLGLGEARDGALFVPASYRPEHPRPLVLMLHGAGGSGQRALSLLGPAAEELGVLVLAPDSRGVTWDAITAGFGPDVVFLDAALGAAFDRLAVDRRRVAVAGFSDGASYALGLGTANGDLFCCVLALSPGLLPEVPARGAPTIFISHGTEDPVLPIDRCSRRLVPALQQRGLEVRYVEFFGRHSAPPAIVRQGLEALLR